MDNFSINRKDVLKKVKCVVVKVGTTLLTSPSRGLGAKKMEKIVSEVNSLRQSGVKVVLVTSGAIAAGARQLGWKKKPLTILDKQAAAAVGQSSLMHLYEQLFREKGLLIAQMLLTRDDLSDRKRYLNARNTLIVLLKLGVLPIINENDSVAADEIKFGDNDVLSALVTNLIEADLLVILSDVDGVLRDSTMGKPKVVNIIPEVDAAMESLAGGAGGPDGTGGMQTKFQAAKIATNCGIPVVIANGKKKHILEKILACEEVGTLFLPHRRMESRKRWIVFSGKIKGKITIDGGATAALRHKGKSLLPRGVINQSGNFECGDLVQIIDESSCQEFARGLTNYSSIELDRIKGVKTQDIEPILGYKHYDEVVHRNNMVIL
ncbi:glutamate 5-kinase [candidate division NPL-UPA2 bacterium Unc8]|uniref:Glutamate 5-kinase n=1 Tax=candidate division NPL-UPA2 bacterium Unc8 TaxID=1980939 RepID=A0A399FYC9_UNCN2|nr:Glutamate 5-kinase [Bacillota bacterium]MBT9138799.1 Glutamate 5-kinase [Bacillota bacterium]MBT9146671.1 Glutamate 5-kinase [Bacillota bacterium]RII00380.1 MAG: glutamate 5-kinase [candidate division NPL-UPA2 bacterium Unc8]